MVVLAASAYTALVSSSARTPHPKPFALHQLLSAEILSGKQERVGI